MSAWTEHDDSPQPTRREFLDRLALGLASLPAELSAASPRSTQALAAAGAEADAWDTKWPARLTGRIKTVFDVPAVESGYGVWRATIWAKQYEAVLGMRPSELSTAVVLRHDAIVLAMQQAFWDNYAIGKAKGITHPATLAPTDRNPVLLASARGEVPAAYDAMALDQFIARGGVALACDLALRDCVALVEKQDGVSAEEARKRAIAYLVPGVILQPSGIFAVLLAQQAGALYVRAS
jgi:hypothetical protein